MRPGAPRVLGVLVPAGNRMHAREFALLRSPAVRFEFREFDYPTGAGTRFCDELLERVRAPLLELRDQGVAQVLFGCATATMQCVQPGCRAVLDAVAGVPVLTAADAVREVVDSMRLRHVAVATPYGEGNNRVIATYLRSLGLQVVDIQGLASERLPLSRLSMQLERDPAPLFELALSMDSPQVEAFLLPCTAVPSLGISSRLERATNKPAVSSVQAGFWASLRHLGLDGRQSGYGKLLQVWNFP